MIQFRQKTFSEYDAMRSLYVELMKYSDRNKFGIVDRRSLIPVLKGNNVVIERFVISSSFFGRDKYRMYLKIGAKAVLPDDVRLPVSYYDKNLADAYISIGSGGGGGNNGQNQNQERQQNNSETAENSTERVKLFSKGKGGDGPKGPISANLKFPISLKYEVSKLLGEAVEYNKSERSLVLEFDSIQDAIRALNILPFGLSYKIYLLDPK